MCRSNVAFSSLLCLNGVVIPGNLRRISRKILCGSAELMSVERYREGVPWTFSCVSLSIGVLVAMLTDRLKFVRKSAPSITVFTSACR